VRVLLIDQEHCFLDFAIRCAAADHDVRLFRYAKPGETIWAGKGFKGIAFVDDWRASMAWAREGLIIASGNFKYLYELDQYRQHGFKIFAPTIASARLEIDRGAGMKAMEAAGIELPPYQVFDSLQDAEKFARKSDRCFVHKPMGDEEDKSLTYSACDPADMCGWLRRKIEAGGKLKGQCMLQEKIDMLCDFGVSGWFGPEGFLPSKWQICFEHKKLMNGEIGPNTPEMGSVCQYAESEKLADEMLVPMAAALQATGHRGDFSVGVGIDTKGKAWPFEFTARCGWPAFYIQTASHKGDPAQWMRELLDGKDTLKVTNDVATGVCMTQHPWPDSNAPEGKVVGNPIMGIEEYYDDAHCAMVMVGKGPKYEDGKVVERPIYMTAGAYVLVATGLGKTVAKSRKTVYRVADAIKFKDAEYRTDIGEKIAPVLPKLHAAGYARDLEYE
jgi:phosphoribosylamine---glycine ligase